MLLVGNLNGSNDDKICEYASILLQQIQNNLKRSACYLTADLMTLF